jgi:hypothetical protein
VADYTKATNFTAKDSLPTGNAGKIVKGTEIDTELNAISNAIASKADSNSPTFTGVPVAPTASAGTNTTQLATTAHVFAERNNTATLTNKTLTSPTITGGTITGITDLTVADGGTGSSTLAANNVLLGNGTSALQTVAPSTSGNVLTSNGTTWTSAAPSPYIGAKAQIFTTVGANTFTVPDGITAVKVTVIGGGGGGGQGNWNNGVGAGGGGGGGGTSIRWITGLTSGGTVTATVGAGGTANSGTGGTSSFGAFASATGGIGGLNSNSGGAGGAGGTGSSGDINQAGGTGGIPTYNGDTGVGTSGAGGAAVFGTSIRSGDISHTGSGSWGRGGAGSPFGTGGNTGIGFGSGASGGVSNNGSSISGGVGSNGVVIVEW